MITELTDQQRKDMEVFATDCIETIGFATGPVDRPLAESIITKMYLDTNLKAPSFIYKDSPLAVEKYIAKETKSALTTHDCFWGQHEIGWIAFYIFMEKVGFDYGKDVSERLHWWYDLAKVCGWWWSFEDLCLISERPTEIHWEKVNNRYNLHYDGGPALKFKDGLSLWQLHGVEVPQELAETPANELKASSLGKYKNVEVRAQFVRKIGIENLCKRGKLIEFGGISSQMRGHPALKGFGGLQEWIDKLFGDNPYIKKEGFAYQLLDMKSVIGAQSYAPYLLMVNPSTGEIHAEGVSTECTCIDEALSLRCYHTISIPYRPVALT